MVKKKKKIIKYIAIVFSSLILLLTGVTVLWVNDTYKPDTTAQEAMIGNDATIVTEDEWITFNPSEQTEHGFIFYPGGLVEPEAYAPLCRKIADEKVKVFLVPMTLNLAVLSPNRAEEVIKANPEITDWTIGGHSLGGVMAANFAAGHKEITNLVLLAAYPQEGTLDDSEMNVLSIYGTLDGVAKMDKVKNAVLGKHGSMLEIPGGNHCFFGSYGMQKGDNQAEVSNEEQINLTAEAVIELIHGGK